jgi:ribose 5-phosphate isomerase A
MEALKRQAAARALEQVQGGMRLGLGTGSTAKHFVDLLGEKVRAGMKVVGVPTSEATRLQAEACGIALTTLDDIDRLDLTVDGADEIDPALNLIKGGGGALLREKIVAAASAELVIVADESKVVERLGTRAPLPVEVDPFGEPVQPGFLRALGCEPLQRRGADGAPFVTDGGNHVLDCRFPGGIGDPEGLERALALRPGIVESGLFLGMATAAVIAGAGGVRVMRRGEAGS